MPNENTSLSGQWEFWIDRGGTFTDIVARSPEGQIHTHKVLSEDPERYRDAAMQGVRDLLGLAGDAPIPAERLSVVKMGTTVGTNALLERKGERTLFLTNEGLGDVLRIGYQARPNIFARHIILPELLYERVAEVSGRIGAHGQEYRPLDAEGARRALQAAFDDGIRSVAIAFIHGYRYPEHEEAVAAIARRIGFSQVSTSHETSALMKLVSRGDTTVVDAYLSPLLRRYVDLVAEELGDTRLMFMQSSGGLTDARLFQGRDCILSGPAGGIVGAVRTAQMSGFERIISFDMGGTSTDVAHYDGELERSFETAVAGVRMRAPMMRIHTVAAGGGSICHFDGFKYRVGPDSAGANPGPACYRRGGPLTVTDCNVMLGKLQPEFFPRVFGPSADQPLDADAVAARFSEMAETIRQATGNTRSPAEVADGFLKIAVENMANAIKQISVQRGHDVTGYVLNAFGGAGGQHACLVADALGMTTVYMHPHAGVLSAYGMGLADIRALRESAVEERLKAGAIAGFGERLERLADDAVAELTGQGVEAGRIEVLKKLHLKYEGTDSPLIVPFGEHDAILTGFEALHRQQFGFVMEGKPLIVEAVSVEVIGHMADIAETATTVSAPVDAPDPLARVEAFMAGEAQNTPVYQRADLKPGMTIDGPAILSEATGTTVIEPGWQAEITDLDHLVMRRVVALPRQASVGTEADPVMLEVFNNLFMSIAEQMGTVLENTAYSVNIKERLDFSCAVFDRTGGLIANAPHMPVHLGSMGESVRTIIDRRRETMKPGDVYMLNDPYNGGTHLPDITVITPVFDDAGREIRFFVASRGHHADIGGITPGSMPPDSHHIDEEGVLIDNFQLVDQGRFLEKETIALFGNAAHPARNITQTLGDLSAQIAANEKGVRELQRMVDHFGPEVVQAYMGHVQDNAEEQVRRVLGVLTDGAFTLPMDNGAEVRVAITIDRDARRAKVDFTGTSAQQPDNFNAPAAVCRAAVLYVFRTLVDEDIPMNDGCLKPIEIHIPEGSMLNPAYPAAVVAGNVEVSQVVTNALYGALKVMAAAQGTMNNFTFGNERYQYYETICGGSGAGPDFDGTSAVHTHMTNSRLTDPEVLEWRYPVVLESHRILAGTGGRGRHSGGDGTSRRIRFLEPMTAAILSNHRKVAPFGLEGGEPGAVGRTLLAPADGGHVALGSTDRVEVRAGDVIIIDTPGGGGFGAPE